MKKIFLLLLLAFGLAQMTSINATTSVKNAGAAVAAKLLTQENGLGGMLTNMTPDEFLKLTPKKVKEKTGKKLTLKQVVGLKAAQKAVKKQMKDADGTAGTAKSQWVALLLCWFFGALGMHRLYLGYKNWWLMLITLGGCGIWALIDFIRIIMGDLKPADGSNYDPSF
ncbi:MAG: TM2 domain-containing protein [Saprospiraceae bacterium]|nr:TM2 domain-containing protein [Saprospiraceae bacterium]